MWPNLERWYDYVVNMKSRKRSPNLEPSPHSGVITSFQGYLYLNPLQRNGSMYLGWSYGHHGCCGHCGHHGHHPDHHVNGMEAYLGWSQGTNLALGVKEWHALWPEGGGDRNDEVDYVDDENLNVNHFGPREAQYEVRGTKSSGTSRSSWPVWAVEILLDQWGALYFLLGRMHKKVNKYGFLTNRGGGSVSHAKSIKFTWWSVSTSLYILVLHNFHDN